MIDTIAKIGITIATGAAAVSTALAVAATAPVSVPVAAVVGTVLGTGVAGGILGGFSNEITGGSFLNGFCGGFANGCIVSTGTLLGYPSFAVNMLGGFFGNMLTESFNDMDIADPTQRKGILGISLTSLGMGVTQGIIGTIFPIDDMLKNLGLVGISPGYLLAKVFEHEISFGAGTSAYIFIHAVVEEIMKFILGEDNTCLMSE